VRRLAFDSALSLLTSVSIVTAAGGCDWVSFDHANDRRPGAAVLDGLPDDGDVVEGECQCDPDQVCSHGSCVDGRLDEDGDGAPASSDCDDHDPDVVPGTTRPCSSGCGDGLETCLNRSWSSCSAPSDCSCAAGDVRLEPCGRCGTAVRACRADGTWNELEACLGEGACAAGSAQVEACQAEVGPCRQHARVCSDSCAWLDWGACDGAEECTPGDQETTGCGACGTKARTCSPGCLWSGFSACAEVRDADGDRHDALDCGGDDCDDANADVFPGAFEQDTWSIEAADHSGPVDDLGNLVLDDAGLGRVTFRRGTSLHILVESGDHWSEETWWPDTGPSELLDPPQIACSPAGVLHIAYVEQYRDILDYSSSSVVHLSNAGGAFEDDWWTSSARDVHAWQPLVALDAAGHAHILFAHGPEGAAELERATDASGDWIVQSLSAVSQIPWGWVLAADDVAHALVERDGMLEYGSSAGGWSWTDVGAGDQGALALHDGRPEAVVAGPDGVALFDGGDGWSATPVADSGEVQSGALAFDAAGRAQLVLTVDGEVRYVVETGAGLRTERVADGRAATIALDDSGLVHVVFADELGVEHATRGLPDGVDRDCDGLD